MAAEINPILPPDPYGSLNANLVTTNQVPASFDPNVDYIEYIVTSPNSSYLNIQYDYNNYSFPLDGTVTSDSISDIIINPLGDIGSLGVTSGNFNSYYNFYKNQLNTSPSNQNFFIKEISSDRTELILVNPKELYDELVLSVNEFKLNLNDNLTHFEDFYLNFGNNILAVANNIDINSDGEVLINLYNPLPSGISVNSTLWIVTKIADSLAFNITFTPDPVLPSVTSFPLRGPNTNLPIKDEVNNSTDYQDYNTLITSSLLSTSYSQLNNIISSSGIKINVDYTDFENFIFFSSATQRLNNFAYKVNQISSSQAEINVINSSFTGYSTSSNVIILTNQINSIIENFDGYEYFLYYGTGSWSWPKSTSTVPYTLYSPTSSEVINWLGDAESYIGVLGSASLYDRSNINHLYNTVPDYIKNDPQNAPYELFINMIGQHFDNIWIYYKDVTELHNSDNRLNYGISKDLVKQALESFGVYIYQNNFSSNDLYSSFLGYGNPNPEMTSTLPVNTGSFQDYISSYITASYDASVTPLDDYNKEIYKRIYHNLPYLTKTKGTIPGLRALINCFGVPDTVLRISEFGGRDKDTSTYDYFDQQFDYAAEASASSLITTPWILNTAWSASINQFKASSIQFRFKTSNFDTGSNYQLWNRSFSSTVGPSASLVLKYTGSGLTTSSYSGSTVDPYYQHAYLTFYPKVDDITNTASIYLPFFDHGWWSVMINKFEDTYTLYAGNKLYYDGYDGNQVGYLSSSSITLANTFWTGSGVSIFLSSSVDIGGTTYNRFTGSYQEVRYWIKTGSVESFKDYIMNPQSIDYSGEILYDDYLVFRLPLGGDLYTNSGSVHPRATGSWAQTSSFIASNNAILTNVVFNPNIETRFLNSPVIGLRGRVTDKIQIVSSSLPTGSVISQYRSIEQSYPSLGSESPDVNLLEVAFSPQNEINDDIIDSLGYFNIGEYIGDPRQVSSSATTYPDLVNLSNNFFQKYFDTYDLKDYVRLIKYFDNSLFKMIKDFIPARTSLTSGVVIKQHILERNKYPQPQVEWEELDYSGSIDTAFMSGSTGGTFNQYNTTTFAQDWIQTYEGPTGISYISQSSQYEFYNGELPGTEFIVTNGELTSANEYSSPSLVENLYSPTLYISNITSLDDFLDINTSPNLGEVYLWYDTGSFLNINPPGVPTAFEPG